MLPISICLPDCNAIRISRATSFTAVETFGKGRITFKFDEFISEAFCPFPLFPSDGFSVPFFQFFVTSPPLTAGGLKCFAYFHCHTSLDAESFLISGIKIVIIKIAFFENLVLADCPAVILGFAKIQSRSHRIIFTMFPPLRSIGKVFQI